MDINQFHACDLVAPHSIIMIGLDFTQPGKIASPVVVYAGPLREVPEAAMETARLSLVHPGTLAAIKSGADALVDSGGSVEPPETGCVTGGGLIGEHAWLPRTFIGERTPHSYLCKRCGAEWVPPLTANQQ